MYAEFLERNLGDWELAAAVRSRFLGEEGHFHQKLVHTLAVRTDELAVINHADAWSSNILFRYENVPAEEDNNNNEEDNPTAAVLLDFQFIRYGHFIQVSY